MGGQASNRQPERPRTEADEATDAAVPLITQC